MPRVLPRHVEKQWGIGGVYPQFEKNLKKVRLISPNSSLSYNENQFVGISGFDEIFGLKHIYYERITITICFNLPNRANDYSLQIEHCLFCLQE